MKARAADLLLIYPLYDIIQIEVFIISFYSFISVSEYTEQLNNKNSVMLRRLRHLITGTREVHGEAKIS